MKKVSPEPRRTAADPGRERADLEQIAGYGWAPIVLTYSPRQHRKALAALLGFDLQLKRIVRSVSEPMLGQLRIAWWREEIMRQRSADAPPPADPLLAAIIETWEGRSQPLVALADGWESLLGDPPYDQETCFKFAAGRGAAFAGYAKLVGEVAAGKAAASHGHVWGLAEIDGAIKTTEIAIEPLAKLPRTLRPLAIIGGLSKRAIDRGGAPLMGDRLSPLAALRLGIFGT